MGLDGRAGEARTAFLRRRLIGLALACFFNCAKDTGRVSRTVTFVLSVRFMDIFPLFRGRPGFPRELPRIGVHAGIDLFHKVVEWIGGSGVATIARVKRFKGNLMLCKSFFTSF